MAFLPKCEAQLFGVHTDHRAKKMVVPFEVHGGFMVVNVRVSELFSLNFIFDTGAEYTLLLDKTVTDALQMPYERVITVVGADRSVELTAYLTRNISLQLGALRAPRFSIVTLKEDYFRFDETTGIQIHGILGGDFFKGFVVSVDPRKKTITFTRTENFKPPRRTSPIPLELTRNRPHLIAHLKDRRLSTEHQEHRLLLDSGAALALLVEVDSTQAPQLADQFVLGNIGLGLGGYLLGYIGKTEELRSEGLVWTDLLTSYQMINDCIQVVSDQDRDGLIGLEVLNRYRWHIDYRKEALYLEPQRKAKRPIPVDMSGLSVIVKGRNLDEFIVSYVIEGSPADLAGIKTGDQLVRIKGWPASIYSLNDLQRLFRKKEGKRIKVTLERNSERIQTVFYLKKYL